MDVTLTMTVNGEQKTLTTDAERPLLDVLREDLKLTGSKFGCGQGQCGACTVLMNGRPIRSCSTPFQAADNQTIVTIEGLAHSDALHPVQQAFLEENALQCGYCTAGMIMRTVALLDMEANPSDDVIKASLTGNMCRCNDYTKILNAVRRAAGTRTEVTAS